jgi:hypothetical protein
MLLTPQGLVAIIIISFSTGAPAAPPDPGSGIDLIRAVAALSARAEAPSSTALNAAKRKGTWYLVVPR